MACGMRCRNASPSMPPTAKLTKIRRAESLNRGEEERVALRGRHCKRRKRMMKGMKLINCGRTDTSRSVTEMG